MFSSLRAKANPLAIGVPYRRLYRTAIPAAARGGLMSSTPPVLLARTRPLLPPRLRPPNKLAIYLAQRSFHVSSPRRDVFYLAFPALKSSLLTITRVTLLMLPFVWRWKLWRKYRRMSLLLVQIPIFALCLIFALALDQSPHTQRWRLMMMGEQEEQAWSRKRAETQLASDLPLLLPPNSPASIQTLRVTERLVTAIESAFTEDKEIVSYARLLAGGISRDGSEELTSLASEDQWGPGAWGEAKWLSERSNNLAAKAAKKAGARKNGIEEPRTMVPGEGKVENVVQVKDWKVYVVDLPKINAFALPSKELFVFSGLIELVEEDELLAAVLSHEMAHVTQRHAVENMGFLNVATVLFDVVRGISYALTLSFPLVTDGFAFGINYLNDVVTHRAYSRKLEMEADEVGLEFMARAGYNPRAAHALWDLMAAVEADAAAAGQPISIGEKFELLQTHPNSGQRQRHIEKLLPRALELYKEAKAKARRAEAMEVAKVKLAERKRDYEKTTAENPPHVRPQDTN